MQTKSIPWIKRDSGANDQTQAKRSARTKKKENNKGN